MTYTHPSPKKEFSLAELRGLPQEDQRAIALFWFRQRYEDPAENMPYQSAEGGYIYPLGGPYDASEVLHAEFGGAVSEDLLAALAAELNEECVDWAPGAQHPDVLNAQD